MEKEKKETPEKICLRLVEIANTNSDKLNEEGKRELAHDIIEEISEKHIDGFVKFWGYKK